MTNKEVLTDELDEESVNLIKWIDAPENLQGLDLVLAGMDLILTAISKIKNYLNLSSIYSPKILSDDISPLRSILMRLKISGDITVEEKMSHPLHGTIGAHPFYALIGEVGLRYELLTKEQIEFASIIILTCKSLENTEPKKSGNRTRTSAINSALNSTRLLLIKNEQLPEPEDKLFNTYKKIQEIISCNRGTRYYAQIEIALRYFIDGTGGIKRNRTTIRNTIIDLTDFPGKKSLLQYQEKSKKNAEQKDSGLSANEQMDEIIYSTTCLPDQKWPMFKSRAELAIQLRHIKSATETANQFLCFDGRNLTDAEVGSVISTLRNLEGTSQKQNISKTNIEAYVLACAVMFTSKKPNQLKNLLIAKSTEKVKNLNKNNIYYFYKNGLLCFPTLKPKSNPSFKNRSLEGALPSSDWSSLPIGDYIGDIMKTLPAYEFLCQENTSDYIPAFREDFKIIIKKAEAFFKKKDLPGRKHDLDRISEIMFRRSYYIRGYLGASSLVFGKWHRLSDTSMHYLNLKEETAHNLYTATVSHVLKLCNEPSKIFFPLAHTQPNFSDKNIGSKITPHIDVVTNGAMRLIENIQCASANYCSNDFWIDLHNAKAAYLDYMLRFTLGLRDVRAPITNWERIDPNKKTVLISDKDDIHGTYSRILPLCDVVWIELMSWHKHLTRWKHKYTDIMKHESNTHWIAPFLVRTGDGVKIVGPTNPYVREYIMTAIPELKLPRNCARHFLCSQLVESGCRGELIETFLGHSHLGRELQGKFSALSVKQSIEELRTHLNIIAKDIGFKNSRDY